MKYILHIILTTIMICTYIFKCYNLNTGINTDKTVDFPLQKSLTVSNKSFQEPRKTANVFHKIYYIVKLLCRVFLQEVNDYGSLDPCLLLERVYSLLQISTQSQEGILFISNLYTISGVCTLYFKSPQNLRSVYSLFEISTQYQDDQEQINRFIYK